MISEAGEGSMLGTLLSRVCSRNISQKVRFKSVWNWGTQPRAWGTLIPPASSLPRPTTWAWIFLTHCNQCRLQGSVSCSALGGGLSAAAVAIGLALLFNDQERSIKFPPTFAVRGALKARPNLLGHIAASAFGRACAELWQCRPPRER
jgi:hypothetical protein